MSDELPVHEAKARLSEILRMVRERGAHYVVSYHGRRIAEIRPIRQDANDARGRLEELEARGIVLRGERRGELGAVVRRPGALRRFLEDRD